MMLIVWLWIAYWYLGLIIVMGFVLFWIIISYMACNEGESPKEPKATKEEKK